MVVDLRKINELLGYWSHTLMRFERIYFKLHATLLFPTLDARSSYYNVTVTTDSRKYTAFRTEYGKYEFLIVLFGIHMAPGYFTMVISDMLKGLDICFAHIDDIMIYSKLEEEQLDHF